MTDDASKPWVDGSLESGGDDDGGAPVEPSDDTATREQREAVMAQAETPDEVEDDLSDEPPA